jgi:hypothetical protein
MITPCLAAVNFKSIFPEAACDPNVQPFKPVSAALFKMHSIYRRNKYSEK